MSDENLRFGFGKNWERYIRENFNEERLFISKEQLLSFLGMDDLFGKYFLDVGCGSGLHSLAALKAGAAKIVSFDYDPNSVSATYIVWEYAEKPESWDVKQGSILDTQFVNSLEPADIVYAWGVLHHTGDMWKAIENTSRLMKKGGLLYLALYTSGVTLPSDEYWLDVKQRYNRENWFNKRVTEIWYVWKFLLKKKISAIPSLFILNANYKKERGMALYTDIVDWLGGWPMEFSKIEDVKQFCTEKLGLELVNIKTGQANTEYLFRK